jgi:methionyl aminopeptidase
MSSVKIKNKIAIEKMRIAGRKLAIIMVEIEQFIKEGVSTFEVDFIIENKMNGAGLKTVCKGYAGYRYATCISLNDVVVHGIPSKKTILKSGDFVKIDVVGGYKGYCVDMARGYCVGKVVPIVKKMVCVVQKALDVAISKIFPGVYVHDISFTIQNEVEREGFGVVRDFAGHGIGKQIHEAPEIPNYGDPGTGLVLREGMTLAIEPMITQKGYEIKVMGDGWTAKTVDGGFAAHVEDTVLVTKSGVEIFTRA